MQTRSWKDHASFKEKTRVQHEMLESVELYLFHLSGKQIGSIILKPFQDKVIYFSGAFEPLYKFTIGQLSILAALGICIHRLSLSFFLNFM